MKKYFTFIVLSLAVMLTAQAQTATPPALGDGTSGNPYQIATLDNLYWITTDNANLALHYIQTANIDAAATSTWFAGAGWPLIGYYNSGEDNAPFTGSYNGQNFTISNLFINRPAVNDVGLFALTSGAVLQQIQLTSVNITGNNYVGALVGFANNSTDIDNCSSTGQVTGLAWIGGLVGQTNNGTTTSGSNSSVTVTANNQGGGGLIGNNFASGINDCFATGNVTVTNSYAGGLTGVINHGASSVTNSNASGNISGLNAVGGFTGGNLGGSVDNCQATGTATATGAQSYAGGFVGYNNSPTTSIDSCSASGAVTGLARVGGFAGQNSNGASITSSHATGAVDANGTPSMAGGFVGMNFSNAVISNCYATGVVDGNTILGGFAGQNDVSSSIQKSFATGAVSGTSDMGGFCGVNFESTISNCYSKGSVTATGDYAGGFVGQNFTNASKNPLTTATINNAYSTGSVTGSAFTGGFSGNNWNSDIINCYWNKQASGWTTSNGPEQGKLGHEMVRQYIFNGWNFTDDWQINPLINDGYPVLAWQGYVNYAQAPSGMGTGGDPYQINSLPKLYWISQHVERFNMVYVQTTQIDAITTSSWNGGRGFPPIGYFLDWGNPELFSGQYDGQDYFITELYANWPLDIGVGLFGYVQSGAQLKNIWVTNMNINGYQRVGGIAGILWDNAFITNCHASGILTGHSRLGGLVGTMSSSITKSSSTTTVTGSDSYVGGLVGLSLGTGWPCSITESRSTGAVSGLSNVGGFIGISQQTTISNCYSRASVEGVNDPTAGFSGATWNGTTSNCYSSGLVTVSSRSGSGFNGNDNDNSTFNQCFWDTQTSGQSGSDGGTGKTTAEMTNQQTFTNAGWDFQCEADNGSEFIWGLSATYNAGYPFLSWTGERSDYCPDWTGALSSAWEVAGNWNPAVVPGIASDVVVTPTANQPLITGGVAVLSLSIADNAIVTLAPNAQFDVNGTLTNNAGEEGLVIQSDLSGTGSLMHHTDNVPATIRRYITGGQYHFASVPLTAASGPTAALFMNSYLWQYDPIVPDWIKYQNLTDALTVDQGYMIWYTGPNTTYSFTGNMNNGAFTASTPAPDTRYNLVPNPYPSAIDWDAADGWTKTNVANATYIYNNNQYATYVAGVGANGGTNIIPGGQAFFVQASGGVGTLAMNNNVRAHSSQAFFNEPVINDLFRIAVSVDGKSDETVVRFTESATASFDSQYDAAKLYGHASAPQLYTMAADNQMLSINSLSMTEGGVSVPLSFEFSANDDITLQFSGVGSFNEQQAIFLEDLATGSLTNLRQHGSYSFNHLVSNDPDRFLLHFRDITGVDEQGNGWMIFANDHKVYVNIPELNGQRASIEMFDVLGSRIFSSEGVMNSPSVVRAANSGVAIVRVTAQGRVYTTKLFIQ